MQSDLNAGEEWRPVADCHDPAGFYEVSSLGRVRRVKPPPHGGPFSPNRVLKPFPTRKGYAMVDLGGKTIAVHRVVAVAFLGPDAAGRQVNHRDGCKTNNVVTNLEYVTGQENIRHGFAHGLIPPMQGERHGEAKLTEGAVREIRTLSGTVPRPELGRRYGVTATLIYLVQTRRAWKHVD